MQVLWLQLMLSWENRARKSVESKKSHRDHKETDEHKLAGLPISFKRTVWSTKLARTWKGPNHKWNQWCNFVSTGQTKSFPIPQNMPCTYMNHMWFEQFCNTLAISHTPHGFTLQSLCSQCQQHSRNIEFPPSNHCFLSTSGFKPRRLWNFRSTCMWSNESASLYGAIMFVALGFGFAENHALSLFWHICLHHGRVIQDLSRIGNKAAQQLRRSNGIW